MVLGDELRKVSDADDDSDYDAAMLEGDMLSDDDVLDPDDDVATPVRRAPAVDDYCDKAVANGGAYQL
ncbi:hypothetical protein HaLaN_09897, partial [Haematococcus lacustris]